MNDRYLDGIKKNKLDFVARGSPKCFILLFLLIAGILLCSVGVAFACYHFNQSYIIYGFCTLLAIFSLAAALALKVLKRFIDKAEFQNMLYSNATKALTDFYLIVKKDGSFVYQDERLNKNTLNAITQHIKTNLLQIKASAYFYQFECMGHAISAKPITRPDGYFALSAKPITENAVHKLLLEKAKIYTYKIKNEKIKASNTKLEQELTMLFAQNNNLHKLQQITLGNTDNCTFYRNYSLQKESVHYGLLSPDSLQISDFFKDLPIGMAILHSDMKIEECNKAFLMHTDQKQNLNLALQNQISSLKHGQSYILNLELKSQTPLRAYIAPIKNLFIGFFIDLSELKALEAKLQQSQKVASIGELTGCIAHDFNNILTAIIGFSDILLEDISIEKKQHWDIADIKSSAQRGKDLVAKLLAFARDQKLKIELANINKIISALRPMLGRLLPENIELKLELASDLLFAKIDKNQFEQCIINLAINARDAILANGSILIKTQNALINEKKIVLEGTQNEGIVLKGQYLKIIVKDSGFGVEESIISKIFDPFFSTKEAGKGTGLGLCTVYGMIKQIGGYIDVKSKPKNGTEFCILLPASYEASKKQKLETQDCSKNEPTPLMQIKNKNILLVEDEEMIRKFVLKALNGKGFSVVAHPNAQDALKAFLANKKGFDLIITDVIMPGISGPEMIKRIRQENKSIKVIFISGYTKDKLDISNIDNVSSFFIQKPFNLAELTSKIAKIFN